MKNFFKSDKGSIFGAALIISIGVVLLYVVIRLYLPPTASRDLAIFDFHDWQAVVVYEGDCGATCEYGDIVVYRKNSANHTAMKELLRIPETPPYGFTFEQQDPYGVILHKPQSQGKYCLANPQEDFCMKRDYFVDTSQTIF